MTSANIVICGAGMAGIAAEYHLAVKHGIKNILLVDKHPPLSLTSAVGTEAYRNWWPGPGDTMVRFMNRSIDLLALWTYEVQTYEPIWLLTFDLYYPEIVLRGLPAMSPGIKYYFGRKVYVDGGYYCKTRENCPLIGPLPVEGAYVIGGLSGYSVMAPQAAADLRSAFITDSPWPDFAPMFRLDRYENPVYQTLIANWDPRSGQLGKGDIYESK